MIMWAWNYHRYGDPHVMRLESVPMPEPPRDGMVVETVSSGVSMIDALYRSGTVRLHGIGFPKRPGFDALGQVTASRNRAYPVGCWVWTVLGLEPLRTRGTAVQYLPLDPARVGRFPDGFVPDQSVGSLPLGALTALVALRDRLHVRPGQRVLVVGAAGAVGVAAIQLARHLGARVDAVCGSAGVEGCVSMGAEQVFDHAATHHDGPAAAYERILVAAGQAAAWFGALKPGGVIACARIDAWVRGLPAAVRRGVGIRSVAAGHASADLTLLAGLVATGELRYHVGRTYPIAELPRAHAELGDGGTRGARLVIHRPASAVPPR